jgi:hypothetical protein
MELYNLKRKNNIYEINITLNEIKEQKCVPKAKKLYTPRLIQQTKYNTNKYAGEFNSVGWTLHYICRDRSSNSDHLIYSP